MDKIKCPICNKELHIYGMGRHCKTQHDLEYSKYAIENGLKHNNKEIIYDKNSTHICEYGCNNIAMYQLKNGKWCCNKSYNSCNAMKQKNSNTNKERLKQSDYKSPFVNKENRYNWTGKHLSEEHKQKISIANKGNTSYNDLSDDKKMK